jgi:hypothetical protein
MDPDLVFQIRRAGELSVESVGQFYDEILIPSFPANELMARTSFRDGFDCGSLDGVFALDSRDRVVGGVVVELFPVSRVLLVAYIAVRSDLRGNGIGKGIIEVARRALVFDPYPLLVVAEVEHPGHYSKSALGDPAARIRLFAAMGAELLSLPYFQPRLYADAERVENLMLVAFYVDESALVALDFGPAGVRRAVQGDVVDQFLVEYFSRAEGELPSDASFVSLRGFCHSDDGVLLLPLGETSDPLGLGTDSGTARS